MNQEQIDISKMFQNKNKEIFIHSLGLEMERNLQSLKHTTDNCVALEINKLIIFFKTYFGENNISYQKDDLITFLYQEKNKLNEIVNKEIEEKKNRVKENFLKKTVEEDEISEDYLEKYYETLSLETEELNNELDLLLKKEICTEFFPAILKKFKLTTKEQEERINSRINILFKDTIIRRIKDETNFRDESLKNMSVESYNHYKELNKKTVEETSEE